MGEQDKVVSGAGLFSLGKSGENRLEVDSKVSMRSGRWAVFC